MIDQFIVAGLSKWRETTRLTLLLPHGYEGNGPEHSSARLERFLQLAAQENIRVANCSTSGQYFHLLRRQALDAAGRPLVVMTPKGLLRLKQASSTLAELAEGSFRPVIDDPDAERDAGDAARPLLGEGLLRHRRPRAARGSDAASRSRGSSSSIRSRSTRTRRLVAGYPNLREVVWAQEEPQNMGAWRTIRHRLEAPLRGGIPLSYVGRPWRASPSEGYPTAHLREQDRIVRAALGPATSAGFAARRASGARLHHLRGDLRPVLAGDVRGPACAASVAGGARCPRR